MRCGRFIAHGCRKRRPWQDETVFDVEFVDWEIRENYCQLQIQVGRFVDRYDSITIDWGDGTVDHQTTYLAWHNYTAVGRYTIRIGRECRWFRVWDCYAVTKEGRPLVARPQMWLRAKEVASAIALRNLMGGFVTVCEIEFVLRHAPIRFRTRIFRDLVRELNAVTAAGETLNFKFVPDYLARFEEGAEKIKTEVRRMKWICKLLRKEIERHGETFWTGLEAWMAAKVSAA